MFPGIFNQIGKFVYEVNSIPIILDQYTAVAPMPVALMSHTCVGMGDGRALVAGGKNSSNSVVNTTYIFNSAANSWSTVAAMPQSKHACGGALLSNGSILIIGGSTADSFVSTTSGVHRYDPGANTWTAVASLPVALCRFGTATLANGSVLVCGGATGIPRLTNAYRYDPGANTWTSVAPLPSARFEHGASLLSNGQIMVFGGEASASSNSVDLYDPVANSWSTGSIPIFESGEPSFFAHGRLGDNRIFKTGGLSSSGTYRNSTRIYDPVANTWVVGVGLPGTRAYTAGGALLDGRMLVCGGRTSSASTPLANTWIYG